MDDQRFCKDCKHRERSLLLWISRQRDLSLCYASPKEVHLVTGKQEYNFAEVSRAWGPCGKGAELFEEK